MDELPQELLDKIIDSIDNTKPDGLGALHACSRVGHSWQQRAQKELFYSVELMTPEELRRWDCNISLESEIPSYVRDLWWAVVPYKKVETQDPFLENEFPGRFASFSNLHTLAVSFFSLCSIDHATIERTFGRLGNSLRSLHFRILKADVAKLCFLISLLPNLRYLHILAIQVIEGVLDDPHALLFTSVIAPHNPRLESFSPCVAGSRLPFEWIEIRGIDDALVGTLDLMLKSCPTTLTTLSMILPFVQPEEVEAMKRLDLSPCSNLHTLIVHRAVASSSALLAVLNTVSSKDFGKLIIGPIPSDFKSWGECDQVLCSFAERLCKLGAAKPLTVVLGYHSAESYAQRVWPRFCRVGVIEEGDWDSYKPPEQIRI